MAQKKTDRAKSIGFKKIKSIVPTNLKFNKLKVNPLSVIEGTKNKIGKLYTDLKKHREKEKKRLEKKRVIDEKKE